jgi:hypothetical protein
VRPTSGARDGRRRSRFGDREDEDGRNDDCKRGSRLGRPEVAHRQPEGETAHAPRSIGRRALFVLVGGDESSSTLEVSGTLEPVSGFPRSLYPIIRDGRIRSDCFTSSRSGIALVPSSPACQVCMATQSGCPNPAQTKWRLPTKQTSDVTVTQADQGPPQVRSPDQ